MKCRSVACIWSGAPPPHRVTAVAALNQPASFYTGGSDGSIIWWNFSQSDSNPEIRPVGMLCGHAAPITDLGLCHPINTFEEIGDHSSKAANSTLGNFSALISTCSDGLMCVWSRSSGHCRCRRKLPPWVGSPSTIQTLPSKARYACIACSFMETTHLAHQNSINYVDGSINAMERESMPRKPPKCTVVIVDTYSLTIVQTVFHGNLSIGKMKFMAVVAAGNDRESYSAYLADSFGKMQIFPISMDLHVDENLKSLRTNMSQLGLSTSEEELSDMEQIVSMSIHGNIIAFVLKNRCIFRLLVGGTSIGEVSFVDNLFHSEGHSAQAHVTGGMFLNRDDPGNMLNTQDHTGMVSKSFLAWNNKGSTIVYEVSYMNDFFKCEPHYEIPATVCHTSDVRLSVSFLQLKHYLLRIESVCFHCEDPLLWKPHVTIWSLNHSNDKHETLFQQSQMLGEGGFCTDWFEGFNTPNKDLDSGEAKSTSWKHSDPSLQCLNNINANDIRYGKINKGKIVSSSMVISENLYAPYAVVYGFFNGEIEVVRFDLFQGYFHGGSANHEQRSNVPKQYFMGHTGPVLCLAAHQMVGNAKGRSFNQVLVSGSMDCTVRIWDLDSGSIIIVMHHHVAPVRQIILPPPLTECPWSDCLLSVGEDSCVTLVSLETLQVERMFPGHPNYPAKVVWDGTRGYIACLCQTHSGISDTSDVLYIWDIKTGARERVLRGTASYSMFDHFCKSISMNSTSRKLMNGNTSVSSLLIPIIEDAQAPQSPSNISERSVILSNLSSRITNISEPNTSQAHASRGYHGKPIPAPSSALWSDRHPIKCSCPFPGIATLNFDLSLLMFSHMNELMANGGDRQENMYRKEGTEKEVSHNDIEDSNLHDTLTSNSEEYDLIRSFEEYLLRFSLSLLHLWNLDHELDNLLLSDMKLKKPVNFLVATGLQGDKESLTLTFPGLSANLELWKSSSEFCAIRSLTMVSLAQRLISLSHSSSAASSSLAAFYTRNFTEKFPDIKPPSLQLLVGFWQDESEHVRMAARSLFHCAASRAIPLPLCRSKANDYANSNPLTETGRKQNEGVRESICPDLEYSCHLANKQSVSRIEESNILAWLESFELQDWISCIGGTSQDAMTSHIIVAAALAIWYPSLVKPSLAMLAVHPLMKLAMAMNEKYSSTASELLAEGMESTWRECISSEIPRLIGDAFFQIELSSSSTNIAEQIPFASAAIRETLAEILLPSLAMADIPGFLAVVESQIWSTASDSPVHVVSLMTLIRVMRGSPRNLAQYLDKVVNFILQTIDPSNSVMRKICFHSSMTTLKEVVRVYPMVAVNETWTRLAVGDVVGEINNASIQVYDLQSVTKIKILDASGPPGLPSLLAGASDMIATAISALSFSPDGEGLVAFSENGLMIRWWSLGSVWWEKLSRNLVPVQCTKLIFVPPWEGFSPNSSRSSIMANIMRNDRQSSSQGNARDVGHADILKLLIHNLDLSYRLEWIGERKVLLTRHGQELGTFQL